MKKILLIIPAYNEALNIKNTIEDIKNNGDYDYVIINDSSKDDTELICKRCQYNYINLPINYGLTSAIQLGMKYAMKYKYDWVIQFDGDGQHKAMYVNDLIKNLKDNHSNIVIGSRFVSQKKPKSLRMLGSRILSSVIFMTTGKFIKDPTSGMRAYDKKCIEEYIYNESLTPEPDSLVYFLKKKYKIEEVQVEMDERKFGTSYLNLVKSIEYMSNMFFSIIFVRFITRGRKVEKKYDNEFKINNVFFCIFCFFISNYKN